MPGHLHAHRSPKTDDPMRVRTFGPLLLLLTALGAGLVPAPLFGQSGEPGTHDIVIASGTASPSAVQIGVGSSVRWVNNDSVSHELVLEFSDGFIFPLLDLQPGADFTLVFTEAETVLFRSENDPGVQGTITVGTPSTTPTATTVPPTATSAPASTATAAPATSTPTTVSAANTATPSPTSPSGSTATATSVAAATNTPAPPASSPTSPPTQGAETPSPSTPAATATPPVSSTTEGSEAATSTPTSDSTAVAGTPMPTPPPPSAGGLGLVADGSPSGFAWLALLGAAVMAFAASALFWSGSSKRITFERPGRNQPKP